MTASDRDDEEVGPATGPLARQRLDKWLWFARVARTRTLAAALVSEGKVRINGERTDKIATPVKTGDVLTILMRQQVRVLAIRGFAARRGSAAVAATLFEDLSPKPEPRADRELTPGHDAAREPGSGRPTKRERREIIRFKSRSA